MLAQVDRNQREVMKDIVELKRDRDIKDRNIETLGNRITEVCIEWPKAQQSVKDTLDAKLERNYANSIDQFGVFQRWIVGLFITVGLTMLLGIIGIAINLLRSGGVP
jgi:hypothetical protein